MQNYKKLIERGLYNKIIFSRENIQISFFNKYISVNNIKDILCNIINRNNCSTDLLRETIGGLSKGSARECTPAIATGIYLVA